MIRRLLCWLGWHEWEEKHEGMYYPEIGAFGDRWVEVCKHCGKVNK